MDKKPTILIVDDMPPVLEALSALLETENCQIVVANDGPEALARIDEYPPDVVLLDVMMPGMDGFEVARRMKANPRWKHIPIVLVTALDSTLDLVHGLEAGADEFLSKPVNGVELRARVRSMLRIKQQYDDLMENLRLREDLANMIVHDMRTPLTIILGNADALCHETDVGLEAKACLEALSVQARRLNGFLTDMLLSAKMEANHLRLNYSLVDVNQLAREAEQSCRSLAERRGRHLVLALPAGPCWAHVDEKLVSRVLDNLLSNALKFSPPGGEIAIRVEETEANRTVSVQVADHGPGIPAEYRDEVFDKFKIVDLKQHGLSQIGLGLTFCKLVAEAHGGHIRVDGNEPEGAIFTMDLPCEQRT